MFDKTHIHTRKRVYSDKSGLKQMLSGDASPDFKNPEMQDIEGKKWYQFTWNPLIDIDLEGHMLNTPIEQFAKTVYKMLKECTYCSFSYTIEPSRKGRYHIHGWIKINDPWNFYQYDIHKLNIYNGMIRDSPDDEFLEENTKYASWTDYCNKCKAHTPEKYMNINVNL